MKSVSFQFIWGRGLFQYLKAKNVSPLKVKSIRNHWEDWLVFSKSTETDIKCPPHTVPISLCLTHTLTVYAGLTASFSCMHGPPQWRPGTNIYDTHSLALKQTLAHRLIWVSTHENEQTEYYMSKNTFIALCIESLILKFILFSLSVLWQSLWFKWWLLRLYFAKFSGWFLAFK